MKTDFPFLYYSFFSNFLAAKEVVVIGNIIGAGSYIETDDNTILLNILKCKRNFPSLLAKSSHAFVFEEDSCVPLRYEIAPFANEKNLAKWTIKKFPKYVYRGLTAFNPSVTLMEIFCSGLYWFHEPSGSSTQNLVQ